MLLARNLPASTLLGRSLIAQTLLVPRLTSAPDVPLAPTVLVEASTTSAATSFATASISPLANQPVFAAITHLRALGSIATPTASGNGLTWTQVDTIDISAARRLTVFKAAGIASPSAGAVTFDFAGQSQDAAVWAVVQFAGAEPSADPVVQFKRFTPAAGTSFTNTLTSTITAGNANLTFVMHRAVGGVITPDSDFAELTDKQSGASQTRLESQWALDQTSCTPSWTGSDSHTAISVEVRAA